MEIEKELSETDIIVSSTDKRGIISYVNKVFSDISEYSKEELYGKPHNIIRHPDMPKTIFKYMWDNLLNQKSVTAYVKNYTKNKDKFYWVKAVIHPVVKNGEIVQLSSYRTKPKEFEVEQIKKTYAMLLDYERSHTVDQSLNFFLDYLKQRNLSYDEFVNRLNENKQVANEKLLNIDVRQFKIDHILFRSRIESLVERGYSDIEVTKPTCCAFGKKLASLEGEPFSNDGRFSEIKQVHDRIHNEVQSYVDASESQRDMLMNDVHKDVDKLFEVMNDLIDNYKA